MIIDFYAMYTYHSKHKSQYRKGIFMGATESIIKMAKENNGTVTTAMVVAAGFSRGNIKYLVDKGMIEKSTMG